jgi:hypothetical protein
MTRYFKNQTIGEAQRRESIRGQIFVDSQALEVRQFLANGFRLRVTEPLLRWLFDNGAISDRLLQRKS